jgi:hypothetical protein
MAMEEQSGNYFYIVFICIGVALLSIGVFYYLTDEGYELQGLPEDEPVEKPEGKTVLSSDIVDLSNDGNKNVELNGNTIQLSTTIISGNKVLVINNKKIGYLSEKGTFEIYKLYQDFLLIKANDTTQNIRHYYIFNSKAKLVKDIGAFTNGTQPSVFENDVFKSTRFIENTTISYNSKVINVCNQEEMNKVEVPKDIILEAEYKLIYYGDDKFDLELVEGSDKSFIEIQNAICN